MLDAQPHHPTAITSYLQQRQELGALLDTPMQAGLELARRHAALADGMLHDLYTSALLRLRPRTLPPVMLAAVGGYGRNQLGWKSDLDVLFVTKGNASELEAFIEAMLYPLWDAGIAIGHQAMRLDELIDNAREALPTATALLDFRRLAGSQQLARELRDRAATELFSREQQERFIARLSHEVEERWRRYGDSVYLLEPDVKNGAGGLRDIDVAYWTARAGTLGADWTELVRVGVLTSREAQALHDATDFFFRVRNHLHHAANRRNDRLTFDRQEDLAQCLGYSEKVPTPHDTTDEELLGLTVEAFMSDYYLHALAVTRAQEHVQARALDRSTSRRGQRAGRELEPGIVSRGGLLGFTDPERLTEAPVLALRLYAHAVKLDQGVMPAARDQISRLVGEVPEFSAALRSSPEAGRLFVELLSNAGYAPFRNGSILGELHMVGLLLAMIPEFAPVVGRVHHDMYHVYTVDVHSVAAADRVRALMRGDFMQRHGLACRLAAEAERPHRVLFAALLHDVGKAYSGKEHSIKGAAMTGEILARFGLPQDDIEHISKLVLHHLTMYFTAARRDLSDPAMIEQFADQVGDRDCLRNLYLLTIADISTTAPTSMTAWKARMLEELFSLADERLAGKTINVDPRRRVRAEVLAQSGGDVDMSLVDELLLTMPERYVLSNSPADVAAHARIVRAARGRPLHLQLVPSRHDGVAELCVVTGPSSQHDGVGDRPGLLAAIAAALTACRLEIYAAQIYTRGNTTYSAEQVLDLFWVRDRTRGIEGVERALPKLERMLGELISGKSTPEQLLEKCVPTRWSDRRCPPVQTEVGIDNRSSSKNTIIEVIAQDRPGVLFTLSHTLHQLGLSIDFAKVNTEGNRVVDIFYVTELDETKLASAARIEQVKSQLAAALLRPAAAAASA
ncbi:MAG: [protein-PII] uridylyltransferase [Polyangiales bacterium]